MVFLRRGLTGGSFGVSKESLVKDRCSAWFEVSHSSTLIFLRRRGGIDDMDKLNGSLDESNVVDRPLVAIATSASASAEWIDACDGMSGI